MRVTARDGEYDKLFPMKRTIGKLLVGFISKLLQSGFAGTNPFLEFNTWEPIRINQRRLEHLASLGLPVSRRTVLEVGAGIGNLTSFFLDRGCEVTATEARPENLKLLAARFPKIRTQSLDVDNSDVRFAAPFDVVFCYGLLYHLGQPAKAIEYMARNCRGLLLLESCVSFGEHEALNPCAEPRDRVSQAVSGEGCRPTRPWVYANLKKHFEFVYMPTTQPNHEQFPINWSAPDAHTSRLSRAIFIGSRTMLNNPLLVTEVPTRQSREEKAPSCS
jgi:SAM-dependent methyltransferase